MVSTYLYKYVGSDRLKGDRIAGHVLFIPCTLLLCIQAMKAQPFFPAKF